MRICLVNHFSVPRTLGGAEIYCDAIATALRARGHDVVVVTNVPGARFADSRIRNLDVNAQPLLLPLLVPDRRVDRALARTLAEIAPDVVHVHNVHTTLGIGAYRVASRYASVATMHDYHLFCVITDNAREPGRSCDDLRFCGSCASSFYPHKAAEIAPPPLRPLARWFRGKFVPAFDLLARFRRVGRGRLLARWIDVTICPSLAIATTMRRMGLPSTGLRVLPNGLDLPADGRIAPVDPTTTLRLGFVGKLERNKGLHVLLEALRLMTSDGPVELVIVGEGRERDRLETVAATLPDRIRTRFLGRVERATIGDVYARFDLLVVPSIWPEVNPLVILEAMAYGRGVVATNIGGMPDQLRYGGGLLVTSGDARDLARALDTLVAPERRSRLAHEARVAYERHFTMARHVDALEEVYRAVTERRTAA